MNFSETPSADSLRLLLARAEQEQLDESILWRLKVILHFAENQYSISETCRHFGISRSTFHRWVERFDPKNLRSLQDRSHEPMTLRQSAVAPEIVELVRRYRMRYPHMGKEKISELLTTDHAVSLSASTVGRVIERECLYFADTPFHWKKRLQLHETHKTVADAVEHAAPDVQAERCSEPQIHNVPFAETIHVTPVPERRLTSWANFVRFAVILSVLVNVAVFVMLTVSALVERNLPRITPTETNTLHAAPFDLMSHP